MGAFLAARPDRGADVRHLVVVLTAGDLAPTVAASLSRQASRIACGAGLLALAVGFAISTAVFNVTYSGQARVDAELSNGADVERDGDDVNPRRCEAW